MRQSFYGGYDLFSMFSKLRTVRYIVSDVVPVMQSYKRQLNIGKLFAEALEEPASLLCSVSLENKEVSFNFENFENGE